MQPLAQRGYSSEQVNDVLTAKNGGRKISFRYDLLDSNNSFVAPLVGIVESCSVNYEALSDIKRTAQFSIWDKGDINWLSDRIQPWIRYEMPRVDGDYEEVLSKLPNQILRYKMDEPPGAATAVNSADTGSTYDGQINKPEAPWGGGVSTIVSTDSTSHVIAMPGSLVAGELIVVIFSVDSNPTCTAPADWNKLGQTSNGSNVTSAVFWKVASGGDTLTVTTSTAEKSTAAAMKFTGSGLVGTSASGSAANTNPPSYTASEPIKMWLAARSGDGATKADGIPSGYGVSGDFWMQKIGDADGASTDLCSKKVSAGSLTEDPAAFTSAAAGAVVWTLGVVSNNPSVSGGTKMLDTGSSYRLEETRRDYVKINNGASLINGLAALTMVFWIKADNKDSWDFIIDSTDASVANGISVLKGPYSKVGSNPAVGEDLRFIIPTTGGYVNVVGYPGSLAAGQTYCVVFTWASGELPKLFMNGEKKPLTQTAFGPAPSGLTAVGQISQSRDIYISGWQGAPLTQNYYLTGNMAEVSWYNTYIRDDSFPQHIYAAGMRSGIFSRPGENYVEWPQGVFLLTTPERKVNEAGNKIVRDVDGYDVAQVLVDDVVSDRYIVDAGDTYIQAIRTLLAGLERRITPTDATLPVAREWEAGTTKLQIINDLCAAINYSGVWFDEWGTAVIEPYVSPSDRGSAYAYRDDIASVIAPDVSDTLDFWSVPNHWVLVVSTPDRGVLRSERWNADVGSPTSTASRNRVITYYSTAEDVADQTELDALCETTAKDQSQIYSTVVFSSALMPHHSHMDVYEFQFTKLNLVDKYSETSWSMDLAAGALMQHSIRKLVTLVPTDTDPEV